MGTKGQLTGDMNRGEIRFHLFGSADEEVCCPQLPDVSAAYIMEAVITALLKTLSPW